MTTLARPLALIAAAVLLVALGERGPAFSAPASVPPSILVDATRDGGAWWYPQSDAFDPDAPHQGSNLIDTLRAAGHHATELYPGTTVDLVTLLNYRIVIRAGEATPYSQSEREAYRRYVASGGSLLLLSDGLHAQESDTLALEFGIGFAGVTIGEPVAAATQSTPITGGVTEFWYGVGSGAVVLPDGAIIDAEFVGPGFLDLDDDEQADSSEPEHPVVIGHLEFGAGRIVFAGDVNMWQVVPQPLLNNVIDWLNQPLPQQPPDLVVFQPLLTGPVAHVNGVTIPGSPGVAVTRITWDWGDGTLEDAWFPNVHTYQQPGAYTLRVTSRQSNGLSTTTAIALSVTPGGARIVVPGVTSDPQSTH